MISLYPKEDDDVMYSRCSTTKAAAQQRLIERCLLNVMQHTPYEKITVSSLCEHAELSRKTFYRLFDSKEDVLHALIDHTILDFESFDYSVPDGTEQAYGELLRYFAYWRHCKPLLDALSSNRQSTLLLERCLIHISTEDSEVVRVMGAKLHPFSSEIVLFTLCGIMGLVISWHHRGYDKSIQDMASIMHHLLTKPPIDIYADNLK